MGLLRLMFIITVVSCIAGALGEQTYNVIDYGAVGDGHTNDTQAFLTTWNATCADATGNATFFVPDGKSFLVGQVEFVGFCKSFIHVQVAGEILRPNENLGDHVVHWILFRQISGLKIDGNGQFNGQGESYWSCKSQRQCKLAPDTLAILNVDNVELSDLRFINSPGMHIILGFSNDVTVHHINITSPADSPNTDGIHVEQCERMQILHSNIGTGDDCISLGNGTINANVSDIFCGPGHGISIGSLGAQDTEAKVENIHIFDSTMFNTTNGIRIKSWQGGSGYAREIIFENLEFNEVWYPIMIDQYYCPWQVCPDQPSAVNISDVQFIGMTGTSTSEVAVSLNCSQSVACQNILMRNVSIQPAAGKSSSSSSSSSSIGRQTAALAAADDDHNYVQAGATPLACTSTCNNAHGRKEGIVVPDVPCLEPAAATHASSFPSFFH